MLIVAVEVNHGLSERSISTLLRSSNALDLLGAGVGPALELDLHGLQLVLQDDVIGCCGFQAMLDEKSEDNNRWLDFEHASWHSVHRCGTVPCRSCPNDAAGTQTSSSQRASQSS